MEHTEAATTALLQTVLLPPAVPDVGEHLDAFIGTQHPQKNLGNIPKAATARRISSLNPKIGLHPEMQIYIPCKALIYFLLTLEILIIHIKFLILFFPPPNPISQTLLASPTFCGKNNPVLGTEPRAGSSATPHEEKQLWMMPESSGSITYLKGERKKKLKKENCRWGE